MNKLQSGSMDKLQQGEDVPKCPVCGLKPLKGSLYCVFHKPTSKENRNV